ncbi:S-layer homology domain-containing protein [Anaerotignum sp.]|uniref:S-layer homology domain-containing protein n=1 Tax=Anaerotignum sp. TaxID=2039241 RepID=UPI002714BA10|nr:S-layer homology domain-containing protein [Anaerotignum sp.]
MKKKLSILLAGTLMISSTVTSFGANFADINDVPWSGAATYINEAASLGLMAGEQSNGKTIFRARDDVTLCETAQIVYNLLKTAQGVTASDDIITRWTPVMASYKIPTWAYTSVAYCLENSIISTGSISEFMSKDGKSNGASREEVAEMIGKALNLVDSSLSVGSTSTSFNDNAEISSSAAGYVALLFNQNILSGDENGNFNPKKTINRAEMAVLTTNSYTALKGKSTEAPPAAGAASTGAASTGIASAGTTSAAVSTVYAYESGVLVSFASGMPKSNYTIDSSVPVSYQDGTAATSKNIAAGQRISITYNGDLITKVVIEEAPPTATLSGTISSLSSTKIKLSGNSGYYYIDEDYISITLDNDDIDLDDLIDAKDDDDIYAKLTIDSDNYVTKIVATTKDEDEDEGTISTITTSKIKLTDGTYYYFEDSDDVEVTLDDDDSDVDELIDAVDDGDTIYVELTIDSDDYITEIEATTEDEDEDEGTISTITTSKIKLTDGTYYYFEDSDDVEVTLDDDDSDVDELIDAVDDGDTICVELTIDSDDYVIEIEATTADEDEGTISTITTSKIKLTDGTYYYFEDSDDVEVTLDDDDSDVDELIDAVDDGDTIYVELAVDSDDYVTKIEATTED